MVEDENLEKTIEESYPNDFGLWPSEISESFCKYWLRNGSKQCQHQNSDFKNSAVIEKDWTSSLFTRKHSLSGELLNLSWLCYSESQEKLYCVICKLLSQTNKKFTKAFNNWRKAGKKIDRHSKLQSWWEALADAVVWGKISSRIDHQLVQATKLESKYWRVVLRHVIDVSVILSTQSLALCRLYVAILGNSYRKIWK